MPRVVCPFKSAIQGAIRLGQKIAGIINEYYDTVDEINTNSKKYGISTDTYQKWKYAAEIIDVSAETMGSSLGKMVKQMSKAPQKFEELGVSIYDASGNMRDSEDVFYDVVNAIGSIENETEQEVAANELFGKSFQELNPLIDAGTDALKDLGQEAEDRHVIMTPEELETMQGAKDALDKVRAQLAVALAPLIEELSPYIEQIAKWIGDKLADPHVQRLLEKVGEAMGKILEGVAQLIQDAIDSGELERFIDWLIEELPNIAQFIVDIVGSIKDVLKAIKSVIDFFKKQGDYLNKFTEDMAKGWAGVSTSADSSIGSMQGRWYKMITDSWSSFKSFGENVKNWFSSIPNKIAESQRRSVQHPPFCGEERGAGTHRDGSVWQRQLLLRRRRWYARHERVQRAPSESGQDQGRPDFRHRCRRGHHPVPQLRGPADAD